MFQVLLPRGGGNHQDLGVVRNNVYVRAPNPESFHGISGGQGSPSDSLPSYRSPQNDKDDPWGVLGDRLHLEKADVQELAAQHNQSEIELPFARQNNFGSPSSHKGEFEAVDHPEFDMSKHQRVVSGTEDLVLICLLRTDACAIYRCRISVAHWTSRTRICRPIFES